MRHVTDGDRLRLRILPRFAGGGTCIVVYHSGVADGDDGENSRAA